jgi:hypothetical protein
MPFGLCADAPFAIHIPLEQVGILFIVKRRIIHVTSQSLLPLLTSLIKEDEPRFDSSFKQIEGDMMKKIAVLLALAGVSITPLTQAKEWKDVVIATDATYPPFESVAPDWYAGRL